MDIDINRVRIHLQIYEIGRSGPRGQKVVVGVHHSLVEIRAAEESAIDEEELVSEGLPRLVRTAYIAVHPDN